MERYKIISINLIIILAFILCLSAFLLCYEFTDKNFTDVELKVDSGITDLDGNVFDTDKTYSMPKNLVFSNGAVDLESTIKISATTYPEYASDQRVCWLVGCEETLLLDNDGFSNFTIYNEELDKYETVDDYIKIIYDDYNGSKTCSVRALKAFDKPFYLRCYSISDPEVNAHCKIDFARGTELQTARFFTYTFNDQALSPDEPGPYKYDYLPGDGFELENYVYPDDVWPRVNFSSELGREGNRICFLFLVLRTKIYTVDLTKGSDFTVEFGFSELLQREIVKEFGEPSDRSTFSLKKIKYTRKDYYEVKYEKVDESESGGGNSEAGVAGETSEYRMIPIETEMGTFDNIDKKFSELSILRYEFYNSEALYGDTKPLSFNDILLLELLSGISMRRPDDELLLSTIKNILMRQQYVPSILPGGFFITITQNNKEIYHMTFFGHFPVDMITLDKPTAVLG